MYSRMAFHGEFEAMRSVSVFQAVNSAFTDGYPSKCQILTLSLTNYPA